MSQWKPYTLLTTLALVLAVGTLVPVSDAAAQGEAFVELMRKDIQTDKVMLMTAALELTSEQGEIFWPLYREYNAELSKIGDSRIKLIKDFAANYETMTNDKAEELAETSFDLQEDAFSLLKKTHKKVSKKIDPIVATRFAQIEKQILDVMDLQIASALPLIK